METPSLNEAKKRTCNKVNIIRNFKIDDSLKNIGKNKKYLIKTYGCQMNERDSENISAILEEMGFKKAIDLNDADLVILNTCAIRENAHNKVFGMLGRLKHIKEERPLLIGLCGCMAQEEIVVEEIIKKHKYINFVFGTHNIHKLPNILKKCIDSNKLEVEVWSKEGDVVEDIPIKRENKYKAWVNIMYGCDKFCTYCIVPYTRGKQRSRLKEDIINEVENLVKEGYQEITLLGQNVNAYGKDIENYNYDFSSLLKDVAKSGISRIRFVTSHPWDFTTQMINTIKEYNNIMPYIHLPVQSGSNKILKLMGRKYTRESYLSLFKSIKDNIPNVSITTDIIVGFPNESEEDFNDTLSLVQECKFDLAYTFIYSPRVGTPASKMVDNISLSVKEERLQKLNDLINKYSKLSNEKLLNKTVSVLIDGYSDKEGMLSGYTDTNKLVNVKAPKEYIGKIIDVKIIDVKTWSLTGEIIK